MKKLLPFLALAVVLVAVPDARADATCFCKLSYIDNTNLKSAIGVVKDITGEVNKKYTGPFQQGDANQTDCNTRCTNAAAKYTGNPALAAQLCAQGIPNGSAIRAWSAVGTREYKSAQYIGVLLNTPAVTSTKCVCPPDTMTNTSNQVGGVPADGKCKKHVCGPITGIPLPPNGTPIGTWGFTWENTVWAFVKPNCTTTTVSPAVCRFQ